MKVGGNVTERSVDANVGSARRRPFWVVGSVLVGLVLLMLVGALMLDRQLRPTVGIEPAVDPTSSVQPKPQTTAATLPAEEGKAQASAGTPIGGQTGANARVATTPLEQEIENAYYRYWEVLTQAYLSIDTSKLTEVASDAELARQIQEISTLKAKGRIAQLQVDHRIAFVQAAPDHAVIYDEYVNRSVFVDPSTRQELRTNDPPETERISFEMRKINGTWKVIDAMQHN